MKHRTSAALLIITAFTLIIVLSGRAQAQTYTQYQVQLNTDLSATWTIHQVTAVGGSVDTWVAFQNRITALVAAAASQTHRQMSVDPDSLQMTTVPSSNDSTNTDYTFTWLNFSVANGNRLVAGDVFSANGFFDQLYGDGELQITYPANCTLDSVTPTPDQKDISAQTLEWFGTQFFVAEKPSIVLTSQKSAEANSPQLPIYEIAAASAVAAVAAVIAAWSLATKRRQKPVSPMPSALTLPVTEEEKVLRQLRASGGIAYQSAITEQCKFSKAKTSQLLSALEREGKVRRVKKGRDKIVNLIENGKGEK